MSISRRRREGAATRPIGRRRTPFFLALVFALAATPRVGASQPAAPERLRLGELYAQVERANPRIAAAQALTAAARARVPGTRRPPDPQLQFGMMNYALPGFAPMPVIGMSQLQLMQMVPLGGKLHAAGRAADAQASSAAERARDVVWETRAAAAMVFYDLYAVDGQLDVARETLRLLQDIERTAQSMYRVGGGRQADVLRAQVEIARMAEDTLRMRAMRATMVAKLSALLDRDGELAIGRAALPRFPETLPTRASLDSLASTDRPMIRAGLEEVRGAEASQKLARREIWPDLQVGVAYGQQGNEFGTDRMGSVMLGASLPVFARSRQLSMRQEAAAMTRMAQADLAAMRAETRGRIGEAYASLERARTLAALYHSTVLPQAEATVASAMAAYRVGGVDFMTLLDDRMTVNRYRQQLFALDADQGKAWAELEMLVGHELIDSNQSPDDVAGTRGVQ
jgi:cobalt-zinc-cadmium efflux system outer membrane protein